MRADAYVGQEVNGTTATHITIRGRTLVVMAPAPWHLLLDVCTVVLGPCQVWWHWAAVRSLPAPMPPLCPHKGAGMHPHLVFYVRWAVAFRNLWVSVWE